MSDLPALRDEAIMPTTFEGMMQQADVLVKSGLLPVEVKTPAAAAAIMLTGRELGIPPMQAFRSVYIVKGKPTLSAQLMGALIFRAGHSYRIVESTNERCVIEFQRRGAQNAYTHEFTMADAGKAGLLQSPTWKAYPKAMLFSRCMSAGARVAMPDVLAGMYTPEELADPDTVVVDDAGEVIDVVARPAPEPTRAPRPADERTYVKNANGTPMIPTEETERQEQQAPAKGKLPPRPWPAALIRAALQKKAAQGYAGLASDKQQQFVVSSLEALFKADDSTTREKKRHSLTMYVFGEASSKTLTAGQASALLDWAVLKETDGNGKPFYSPSEFAPSEAAAMVAAYDEEQGQMALALGPNAAPEEEEIPR